MKYCRYGRFNREARCGNGALIVKILFFWGGSMAPVLDSLGEQADVNMWWDGLRSMIHEDGEPESPSD